MSHLSKWRQQEHLAHHNCYINTVWVLQLQGFCAKTERPTQCHRIMSVSVRHRSAEGMVFIHWLHWHCRLARTTNLIASVWAQIWMRGIIKAGVWDCSSSCTEACAWTVSENLRRSDVPEQLLICFYTYRIMEILHLNTAAIWSLSLATQEKNLDISFSIEM